MEDKDLEQTNPEDITFNAEDYINNLNALKQNMVSKEEYQKVLADNKRLVNALANGDYSQDSKPKEPVDIDKLRYQLFSPETQRKTNLQYFTEVMALRDALIESGQPDPFLPCNKEYIPTQQDIDDAERIASNIKECIEQADGDSHLFNVVLQGRCKGTRRG